MPSFFGIETERTRRLTVGTIPSPAVTTGAAKTPSRVVSLGSGAPTTMYLLSTLSKPGAVFQITSQESFHFPSVSRHALHPIGAVSVEMVFVAFSTPTSPPLLFVENPNCFRAAPTQFLFDTFSTLECVTRSKPITWRVVVKSPVVTSLLSLCALPVRSRLDCVDHRKHNMGEYIADYGVTTCDGVSIRGVVC